MVAADEVTLGPLMAQYQGQVPIEGHSSIDLDLRARGDSAHQLASSMSGSINLALENARIPKYYVDQLSVNVFGWVISRAGAGQQQLNLNCLVMTFDANEGMVESETIIADGPRLSIGGQIDLDLGNETLDIVLVPKQKHRYFSSISPVSVKGPIRNPTVEAVPVRAALQEIGSLVLIPGIVLPARAIGKLWSWLDDEDEVGEGCAGIEQLREAAKRANTEDEEPAGVLDWLRE